MPRLDHDPRLKMPSKYKLSPTNSKLFKNSIGKTIKFQNKKILMLPAKTGILFMIMPGSKNSVSIVKKMIELKRRRVPRF
jgi:hypothetical protein